MHGEVNFEGVLIETTLCYDFNAFCTYMSFYVPAGNFGLEFHKRFLERIQVDKSLTAQNKITLPSLKFYNGNLKFENVQPFKILSLLPGEFEWKSIYDLPFVGRIYMYSENSLSQTEIKSLYTQLKKDKYDLQFRSLAYRNERNTHDKPMAFVSHDSRDKEAVAKKLAIELQSVNCPVWYDEFSLKVGDNLRATIEKGLKECAKCILVLSPNFLSNNGWTKTEFDSIFTRQIIEESNLLLPIWHNVSKQDVYNYSPSLANIKGITWDDKNIASMVKQLKKAIDP
jgi:hypothetical protein